MSLGGFRVWDFFSSVLRFSCPLVCALLALVRHVNIQPASVPKRCWIKRNRAFTQGNSAEMKEVVNSVLFIHDENSEQLLGVEVIKRRDGSPSSRRIPNQCAFPWYLKTPSCKTGMLLFLLLWCASVLQLYLKLWKPAAVCICCSFSDSSECGGGG